MTKLTPEVREVLDEYIEKKERRVFVIGASTVVAAVALMAGFLSYVINDARTHARIQANEAFGEYRANSIDEIVEQFRSDVDEQKLAFREVEERIKEIERKVQTSLTNAETFALELEAIKAEAESALDGLQKAEQSIVFAREILDLRAQLHKMDIERGSDGSGSSSSPTATLGDLGLSKE